MTEIVKAFRERVPAARLIGKRYSMAEEGAASHWGEWFENGWFLPLPPLRLMTEMIMKVPPLRQSIYIRRIYFLYIG